MKKIMSIIALTLMTAYSSLIYAQPHNTPFADIEGKIRQVNFLNVVSSNKSDYEGIANILHGDNTWTDYFIDRLNKDLAISLVTEEGKDYFRKPEAIVLRKSKRFTLYTFAKLSNHIEQTTVEAKTGICADYAQHGLKVKIANNFYHDDSNQFVTFYSTATVSKQKTDIHSASFDYSHVVNLKNINQIKAESSKHIEHTKQAHYQAFKGFMDQYICH